MMALYLSGVLVYGVLALVMAVPLGALAVECADGMLLEHAGDSARSGVSAFRSRR